MINTGKGSSNSRHAAETLPDTDSLQAGRQADPEVQLAAQQQLARVYQQLAALPLATRQAFIMFKFQGQSYAQIAASLGVSVSMVEKHLDPGDAGGPASGAGSRAMNRRQPNSSSAEPAQAEFTNAADAASRWWLQLQQATTLTQQAEFQQWLAADPRHADYYQQCCELQQQLSALSPVWQQQLMQAEPAAWTAEVSAGLLDPPEAAVAPNQLHTASTATRSSQQ